MRRCLRLLIALVLLVGCTQSSPSSLQGQSPESRVAAVVASENNTGMADFPRLSAEQDWPWWRGPSRRGLAPDTATAPTQWSPTTNVVWKTPLPGRGHSSPIIVGDHVFLLTADEAEQTQSAVAFDRRTGRPLWGTEISRGGFPASIHSKNTHATPTMASDGERLFLTLFHHETIYATALDLDGQQLWQQTVGSFNPKRYEYGYGPSPLLYRGTVIVAIEGDGDDCLTALDRRTGKQVWRTARAKNTSYSSPVVGHIAGRDQLLISGNDEVTSYDPNSGDKLWSAAGTTAATCGTLVWEGDVVVASGGYPKSETLAVRGDGSGTVLWRNKQKCYEQSLLVVAGHVYALTDNGVMFCWRLADGQEMWKQRLKGPVSASPVLIGGHIYWANELGTLYVLKPNPERLEMVAENQLGDESFASPAVSHGQLFLRVAQRSGGGREEFLYCLGSP